MDARRGMFVVGALIVSFASGAWIGSLVRHDRAAIAQIVREVLVERPQILAEAARAWQGHQRRGVEDHVAQVIAARADELLRDPESPVAGNPQGDVTIVEFFDYRCAWCRKAQPDIARLLAEDPNLRLVAKELPILGPDSIHAARAALAARAQGRYLALSNALMAAPGALDQDRVLSIAAAAGLDVPALVAELDRHGAAIDAVIASNMALAKALGIRGTPGFVIGGQVLRGAQGYEALKQAVADERRAASSR
ncbi:MAG: DsbA family protein [Alphaproteobacteria bacterium]|nr:DsbA family protein [Alphaproteobacteria bacterium]